MYRKFILAITAVYVDGLHDAHHRSSAAPSSDACRASSLQLSRKVSTLLLAWNGPQHDGLPHRGCQARAPPRAVHRLRRGLIGAVLPLHHRPGALARGVLSTFSISHSVNRVRVAVLYGRAGPASHSTTAVPARAELVRGRRGQPVPAAKPAVRRLRERERRQVRKIGANFSLL
jgi:hypothetical protein